MVEGEHGEHVISLSSLSSDSLNLPHNTFVSLSCHGFREPTVFLAKHFSSKEATAGPAPSLQGSFAFAVLGLLDFLSPFASLSFLFSTFTYGFSCLDLCLHRFVLEFLF